jgi:lysozyme family protein
MYTEAFEKAVDHAMLYEVGGHWNPSTPGVAEGLISTSQQKRNVGYVNHKNDRGGETKFGIAARAHPDVNIADLTWPEAKELYYQRYWLLGKCDQLSGMVAILHFDGGVNHGFGRANKFLQTAVGAVADGAIGPKTLAAVNAMDPIELCHKICDLRETFYRNIVKNDNSQAVFLNGWLRRITEMRKYTTS